MTNRKPVVAANWKMNGNRQLVDNAVQSIAKQSELKNNLDVVISPPATLFSYLDSAKKTYNSDVILAAQNISEFEQGAITGELSVHHVKEMGCQWVICGHSERRSLFGERSSVTAQKVLQAKKQGLKPIICVGETAEEYEAGKTYSRLTAQIEAIFNLGGEQAFTDSIVAYEPVWAVGTGKAASPELAQEIHHFIRGMIRAMSPVTAASVRILYGGSVTPDNAAALFSQPDIDGGLIGAASLVPEKFIKICQAAMVD
ncbi:triose-phosphate isomerase [Catenovulum maritimum]|uniref:Triosephosphate isomerase n=1 Tax=Catenovulum maritimum TaxID=1513271 RepID=A0A0J8GMM2_9ALTE|nr:triose-phosphate isomerase [Catenovulum maritimum]KMT64040.1 hypothetical protein XM47_16390 [Catenovulum maritimum]